MARIDERTDREPPLGQCPNCDVAIPAPSPVIAFDSRGDWPRMLAECPACENVVIPQ